MSWTHEVSLWCDRCQGFIQAGTKKDAISEALHNGWKVGATKALCGICVDKIKNEKNENSERDAVRAMHETLAVGRKG